MRGICIILLFLVSSLSNAQQLSWPETKQETKPWTRMWWMGSIGTQADLTSALEKYKEAGLGGIEVTCIYGVRGQEEKFVNYLSPEWMDKFIYILREAERLGLGVDLANASGWPFGGPWVKQDDACRNINFRTYSLKEGETLPEKIVFIQQALVRPVGQRPDIKTLSEPIARNKNLQLYALDQIRFEKKLQLTSLMAYSGNGEPADLTSLVDSDGTLNWKAPACNWNLYALFEGWHGKLAERAGPGGEGDVIDHFSPTATCNFLTHFDSVFRKYDVRSLRGYFNDSYEVDDASGQADWTTGMFDFFRQKRGYDLKEHLPALFQNDTPEMNERVLSDYRQTISDLILGNFTEKWTSWANDQQKITRNQSHGSPGNILDLYAASDIPETEGYELTKLKFASSAAHVTGKNLVSCEAATWLNEHFISTLADAKKCADLHLLGGINHLFWHGTCFSPEGEPWPGFQFYAAVEFSPANPFWNDFTALNEYVARVQAFMQKGKPDNDILLYFPIFDRYAQYGRGMLEHFDAIPPQSRETHFGKAAELLPEKGYSYDFISDMQIEEAESGDGNIITVGNNYDVLIIPSCRYIPLQTFERAMQLAEEGSLIIFYGGMPENVAGYADLQQKTERFIQMKNSLVFHPAGEHVSEAKTGKGRILSGDNLEEILAYAGTRRESMAGNDIMFTRRMDNGTGTYFIKNTGKESFEGWLPLNVRAKTAGIFNPSTGLSGSASVKTGKDNCEIYIQIRPEETFIIETYQNDTRAGLYPFYKAASGTELKGKWKLGFVEGGPVLPESREIEELVSWTETGGEDARNFSGTAVYSISFRKPSGKSEAYILDLGKVFSSARVSLNGQEIAVLTGPHFTVNIDGKLLKKNNRLEIKVSNLMANRIAWMDRNNIEWKKFYNINFAARLKENNKNGIFDASHWKPLESGLVGPVRLLTARHMNIEEEVTQRKSGGTTEGH